MPVDTHAQAFAYIFEGDGIFADASDSIGVLTEKTLPNGKEFIQRETTGNRSLVIFSAGDEVVLQSGDLGIRFLLVSGRTYKRTGRLARPYRDEYVPGNSTSASGFKDRQFY